MSKAGKFFSAILVLVILFVGAAAVFVTTFDIDKYRDQIADALSKQTGRTVKFGGPIKLAVNSHGIGVEAENASIGNPSWASRPEMASIGKLQLGVGLMPLLEHKVVITDLDVRNADIQLETNASNQHNWDMKPAADAKAAPGTSPAPAASEPGKPAIGVSVEELSIVDSQIAMRDKDGKMSTLKVSKLTLSPESRGIAISLNADYNGQPIKLALKTGATDLMAEAKWPYDADITYANIHLNAQGNADMGAKTIEMNPYDISSGGSSLHGQITANLGGAKTEVRGTIMGDKVDPSDFKMPGADEKPGTAAAPQQQAAGGEPKQLFSTTPIDLSALKTADATIDIAIGELTLGKATLKQVGGKVALANGDLTVSPFKATLGEAPLQGDIKLNAAASPAQYNVTFKAPGVDIATLLEMMGMNAFMSGKGDADIELAGSGNSPHEMAASANGHIIITAAGGQISTAAAGGIASGLAEIFAPGSNGNPVLNCVATRFNVTSGVGKDNGMLADSSASTVAGSGGFNLGAETVDLTLNAKPKLVDTKGYTPALTITGSLSAPKIGIDAAGTAQNVAGNLLKNSKGIGGSLGGILGGGTSAESTVPALATDAPKDQNACLYTLDHKPAAAAAVQQQPAGNNALKDVTGQAPAKAKDLGKQLMQGILGH